MTYRGRVQSGVIVLDEGMQLPEGTAVSVEPLASPTPTANGDPLYRLAELATATGIPDLALNVDHYLYGHPKATDVQP
jgi:hypothetical protein